MVWFKRITLFIITNILVMVTLSIAWSLISSVLGIQGSPGTLSYLMIWCLLWGMGGAFISLLLSKVMAKWMMGLTIIAPTTSSPQERDVLTLVHNLAERAGLPKMPEVAIYDSPDINAFATGPSKANSLVAVSTGLLNNMNRDEIEGVLGHEVAHIANGDMVTMTLIQGIVNAFAMFFSRIISNVIASQVDEKISGIVRFVSVILFDIMFTILGSIVVNYFSRQREFRADAGGAKFAGRQKMLGGLRKLKGQFDQLTPDTLDNGGGLATLKISNRSTGIMAFFSTHPPLAERIRRLESSPATS
jgi:heat shock protein HtpX